MIDPQSLTQLGLLALLATLVVYFLMNPEKVEIWSSLIARAFGHSRRLFRGAHKHYVKHDLQGRVNEFTKKVSKQAPYLGAAKCRIEWETGEADRKSFLADDEVVIRLRRDDPDDMNFVRGAYVFVSTALLHKAKRYISPSQRESIDLFVTTAVIQQEKVALLSAFLDEYLHPATADAGSKVTMLFDQYSRIDRTGLFYSVFLQELQFLGDKVFGGRREDAIIIEVSDLISFLDTFGARRIGEEGELHFNRTYCRFALMIVGRYFNVAEGARVYINYIERELIPKEIDTLYVLGNPDNESVFEDLSMALAGRYDVFRRHRFTGVLNSPEGEPFNQAQVLYILRRRGAVVFQPSS